MPKEDLAELIESSKKGDNEAFGKIYELFFKRIYRYIYFSCHNNPLAEDLTQETFFKAYRSLSSFKVEKGGSFQAFLFRIARNLLIDESRKKKSLPLIEASNQDSEENLEDKVGQKEEQTMVLSALAQLGEKDRQIVVLRYFEDLSYFEIAQIVVMKEGAVRVRLHRNLAALKKIMEK